MDSESPASHSNIVGQPAHEPTPVQRQGRLRQLVSAFEDVQRGVPSDMSRDELSSYIDGAIPLREHLTATAEGTLLHLRSLRNNNIPPSRRLPSELLSLVFSYLSCHVDLICATHVCRTWRASALDCALLWTHLEGLTDVGKAKAFVERSKQLPLHILIRPGLSPSLEIEFSSLVRNLSGRLRSLIVEAETTKKLSSFMISIKGLSAPHLHTLRFLVVKERGPIALLHRSLRNGIDLCLVNTSSSSLPSLRSLRLHYICAPWSSNIYTNLSVLELNTLPMHPPSQQRLLEILKQCPGLTYLNLCLGYLAPPHVPREDPAWVVALPLLSTLKLKASHPGVVPGLLPQLSLTSIARYDIRTRWLEHNFDAPYRVLPADCSRHPALMMYDRVEFSNGTNRVPEMSRRINFYHHSLGELAGPIVSLQVDDAWPSLTGLVGSVDLSPVETFVVCDLFDEEGAEREWETLFSSLNDLRTLRLVYPMEETVFANALTVLARRPNNSRGEDNGEMPLCMRLVELELIGLKSLRFVREPLLEVCRWRKHMGVPLARLELLEVPGVCPKLIQQLQELVPEVSINEF